MLRDYRDIIDRLGPPQWWDDNGAPRYCDFHPDRCGVYDKYVALNLIECQDCRQPFTVAVSLDMMRGIDMTAESFPSRRASGAFHFGDPPPHGCVGDTMNCETRQVLQFWRRDLGDPGFRDWQRDATYEVTIAEDDDA